MNDIQQELVNLEALLIKHDKYYDSSDDHSVFKKGEKEWDEINSLSKQLKVAGYAEEVQELFKKYY